MIEKLDNNEQILLMYLAGELPAEDQADVERLLAIDAGLRRSLVELQACQTLVDEEMARLDELSPLPVSVDAAARQADRAMRQRLAEPKVAPTSRTDGRPHRSWWWLYPTVAAASVLIVAMLWLNRQVGPMRMGPDLSHMNFDEGNSEVAVQTPPPAPSPAGVQNSREADDALLLDSLKSPVALVDQKSPPDEDAKRLALNDAMPQDEVSQVLLNANGAQQ